MLNFGLGRICRLLGYLKFDQIIAIKRNPLVNASKDSIVILFAILFAGNLT